MLRARESWKGFAVGLVLVGLIGGGGGWGATVQAAEKLIVATKEAPPFALKGPNGQWEGISVDLWRQLAKELQLEYEFREMTLAEMLEQVQAGRVDAAVAALTINPQREAVMDFTHPYFRSGLGLAFCGGQRSGWLVLLGNLFSWEFLSAVGALAFVLFLAALGVWFFERRANPEQFGGTPLAGLGSSFWWSAVTMTTVGYGDKAPRTLGGRVVALVWMFASVIVISSFTAAIASSVTVHNIGGHLLRSRQLSQLRIGTVSQSTGELLAKDLRLTATSYPTLAAAVAALQAGEKDAVLYDLPILKYEALRGGGATLDVTSQPLLEESYSIALPSGSPLRERLNVALLDYLRDEAWAAVKFKYLGE